MYMNNINNICGMCISAFGFNRYMSPDTKLVCIDSMR